MDKLNKSMPVVMVMEERKELRKTHMLERGDYDVCIRVECLRYSPGNFIHLNRRNRSLSRYLWRHYSKVVPTANSWLEESAAPESQSF